MKCMRRLVRRTTRLYPRRWRKRYGPELDALLDDVDLRWRDIASVVQEALAMRWTSPKPAARSGGSNSAREGTMKELRREENPMRRVKVVLVVVVGLLAVAIAYVTSGGLPVRVVGSGPDGQGSFVLVKPGWVAWLMAYRIGSRPEAEEWLANLYTRAACQSTLSLSFQGDQVTWPLNPPVAHDGSQHVLTAEVKRVVVDQVNSLARTYDDRVRCVVVGSGNDFWDYRVTSTTTRTTRSPRTAVFTP